MEQSQSDELAPDAAGTDENRDAVAQATGVLVAQFGIATDDAFEKLAAEAADSDRPVVEVAREIVERGGL